MLFNSFIFLLVYAPIAITGFYLFGARTPRMACAWLGLASLVFYAWWHPAHVLILIVSILLNFWGGHCIRSAGIVSSKKRKTTLTLFVAANLCALAYYKYVGFFAGALAAAADLHWNVVNIVLPLGISFFTFTQIAYLVDTYQGKVDEHDFIRYLLFVTYFPHLVAGPIIHHRDVMTQFGERSTFTFNADNFATGVFIFILGLFKKVVIADNLAQFSAAVFSVSEQGLPVHGGAAWAAALAYALQLYFDFSGYSDMAIGLSLMLNVKLPFNFNSPYKSRDIIDFWRRWHISLSTFLRDYLYIPLGGNRRGNARRYINMGATMVLGGLWHGAGWNFIIWGALHGAYLAVNHAWRTAYGDATFTKTRPYGVFCWLLTFFVVLLAWVFFRAQTLTGALHVLGAMAGMDGAAPAVLPLAGGHTISLPFAFACLLPLLTITVFCPNSQEITAGLLVRPQQFIDHRSHTASVTLTWRPAPLARGLTVAVLLAAALACMSQPTEFLYFNF